MSGLHRRYPKSVVSGTLYAEFEGHYFPIPVGYDEVLKICYGDYMQIPDKDHIHVHNIIEDKDI